MAVLSLHYLLCANRLRGKLERRTHIGHDCVDYEFVIPDFELETPDVASIDDRLHRLLASEFDPGNDIAARAPNAGISLNKIGNSLHVRRAGINDHFYSAANAEAEDK